ncbi:MAG: glutamate-5-semialdehyde dehydrogenase [Eubacterium coprostanoligenes]|uniref:glutamate-5-semialdehyde dehydrogenase n=1 Tax=Eubacterium coprostanoligenes TaxID=290054 RepID=UPI002353D8F4|nr:glutamate-5-semialdehyde dehydrogenase [Eubacterium coprostanoligenes]MCI7265112.1 glutamate-5-semialdehyde dehydrogenase [Eubacterium coprostanoligenes]
MTVFEQGKNAKQTLTFMSQVTTEQKNNALGIIADMLEENIEKIVSANAVDIENGRKNGLGYGLIDRLMLNADRIKAMADGARQVASLPDPCGRLLSEYKKDNGLDIKKITVPLGVIGIIFEARPNVTVDAAALCLKSGNAVILRGGKEAINSNTALADIMREALAKAGFPQDVIQLVGDTSRQSATDMMNMNEYLDCLIPRGGKGLIKAVVENSTVPVIETGSGNCHIYVDESADINMAANIIFNAKTQRISVCNACESLVINSKIINKALPIIAKKLKEKDVEIRGDERAQKPYELVAPATDEDFATEYLDYIISVKTVDTIDEAIAHINANSTGHSEAIITENKENAEKFLKCIDSSSVYVNASTRFTDGGEFGLGSEIGISTQKLHARGPMGLEQLTSTKYLIYGDGQVR